MRGYTVELYCIIYLQFNSKSNNVFRPRFTPAIIKHIFNKYTLGSLTLADAASLKVYSECTFAKSEKLTHTGNVIIFGSYNF
jgi:hypothetical protein